MMSSMESAAQFALAKTFQGDRNGGLLQVGCLYAWNMQNEQSKDIFESCFMHLSAFELILL